MTKSTWLSTWSYFVLFVTDSFVCSAIAWHSKKIKIKEAPFFFLLTITFSSPFHVFSWPRAISRRIGSANGQAGFHHPRHQQESQLHGRRCCWANFNRSITKSIRFLVSYSSIAKCVFFIKENLVDFFFGSIS